MDWLGLHFLPSMPAHDRMLLNCTHNPSLILLAYLVACAAGFATLDIAERVGHVDNASARLRWRIVGALCLAVGIWAMHFISMLSFRPPLEMHYNLPTTVASLAVALVAGVVMMQALGHPQLRARQYLTASVCIGLGITAMHYLGMSAMRSSAMQYYEPMRFASSIIVAIASSLAALVLAMHLRQGSGRLHQVLKSGASLMLGAGIVGTHFMGMWALQLTVPDGTQMRMPTTDNSLQLSLTIALIVMLIIAGSISAALADKKLQAKEHDLQRVNALLSQLDQARLSLQQAANFDALTNLINRRGFNQIFAERLTEQNQAGGKLAVMFLDVDYFKRINDSLGHDAGDELLKVIAERIRGATRSSDVVARFGGDEFCILIALHTIAEARHMAQRVMIRMKDPIALAGRSMVMTTSIGVSIYPDDGQTCDELLKSADLALYQSKDNGRNTLHFFNEALKNKASLELHLEEQLRDALSQGQGLLLFYQPIVDLRTGHVAKLEALVRWQHPVHGLLTPDRFITIAETNGLIAELDNWVLRRACRDLAQLCDHGFEKLVIAVNCSALNLARQDLVQEIDAALKEAGVPPHRLELEVTENALMCNISNTVLLLNEIRTLGVALSIDDFGTGYSSLAYLKRLPLDTVKIDRSFIVDTPQSPQDMEIVHAIILMAHTLHLKVVTEGVETPAQLEFLSEYGCDYVQGYLFSKPAALETLRPLVQRLNQSKPCEPKPALQVLEAAQSSAGAPFTGQDCRETDQPRADRFRSRPQR
ncbi:MULTISPECIES: putative bifunctional diguanylate cyclase/phosphodiesterase [unclassified Pseudomonas]|uniref:putative bifunctional diguanylate cyclase/phosphodiesterase n=1 Tax=unclassified Pseudomonas TaxID=196821 RepID=UPI0025ECAFBD|nr:MULTISPECIES: bifunctional diguanylate cyclase/phosphodiesterase [unclassified Pseudomonas]